MTHSVHTSQSLSQPIPSLPNGFMNKVEMMVGIEVMNKQTQQRELLVTKADLVMITAECPVCPLQISKPRSQHDTASRGVQPIPDDRLITLLSQKEQCFLKCFSFRIDTIWICLPSMQYFYQICYPWTRRMPYLTSWQSTWHSSVQGAHLKSNGLWQWAHACGIHWSQHIPHPSETAGLIGQ